MQERGRTFGKSVMLGITKICEAKKMPEMLKH